MLKEIVIAIQSYFEAHAFIRKHRLGRWILLPGLLYLLLFVFGIYFFWQSSDGAVTWLSHKLGLEAWLQRERNGFLSFLFMMAGLFLRLILLLFYFSLFKYFFLILGSPVFAYLSEKTEALLEGKDFPFSFRQLLHDILRGIRLSLRNGLWQTVYMFSLLLLSLIPVAGWITPLIALFVECYYYGFSMLDYSLERARMSTAQSIDFVARHKGLAIGNGMLFYLMHLVPILGWVLAPAYAVIAATLSVHKIKNA
ncbi:EI24 domain-containing protein [Flaviaesturariibacter amylovorans]|uniref:EI24 domain-containing protein n=1 Tax=Flaviaesturariibacter amylovorans TaxID=1084520 RepID=A0ABP8G885_9BACT